MTNRLTYLRSASILAILGLALGGCASFPVLKTTTRAVHTTVVGAENLDTPTLREKPQAQAAQLIQIPKIETAAPASPRESEATDAQIDALIPANAPPVEASIAPQPLPQFLDTAFGDILKIPYSAGPNVASMPQIITLRSGGVMSRRAFFRLVQVALHDYGLRVYIRGGNVAVLDEISSTSPITTVLRSRSALDTPEGSRTVIQYFQLQALEVAAVQPLLQDVFPGARAVKMTPDPLSNSLIISGSARDVQSTINMLRELDKPIYAGATVARLQPVFWTAEAFATALDTALTAEGYKTSRVASAGKAILLLPLVATNQVLVFVNDPLVLQRVEFWAHEIDQPGAVGEQKTTFVYEVHNTDAQGLGALVTGQGTNATNAITTPVGVPGQPTAATGSGGFSPNRGGTNQGVGGPTGGGQLASGGAIVVDAVGNRILFTGTAQQFAQLRSLLEQLDIPPAQVMIEVTVAEVSLTDSTKVGLEWFFTHAHGSSTLSGGTEKGLGIGTSGLSLNFVGTDLRAAFDAFASNNKVNILSRPRLVARSGTDASINVGTDIPIITSQAAGGVQTGGTSEVLQTVQYRQTGIILKIKPVVYGDSRVDLEISQEVSNQTDSANAAIASPSILNRSVSTKILLTEGSTSVLGGLISNNFNKSNTGVPFIKDIPILGTAFRTDVISGDKTELVILVTPFIIRDADQMTDLATRLSGEMNQAYRVGRGQSYTLTGIATGANLGFDLPPARPSAGGQAIAKTPKAKVIPAAPMSPAPPLPEQPAPAPVRGPQ